VEEFVAEAALFVDLENIVTSLWKTFQQVPDPMKWMEKVRAYGPVSFARAYGDFSQGPIARIEQRLRTAGIEPFNCPVKVRDSGSQSTVDINIAIDLYEVALDRSSTETFVLMAGDSDYVRIVARLRNRLSKRIVIAGVPGSVSRQLIEAAGEGDPIMPSEAVIDHDGEKALIRLVDRYQSSRKPGVYATLRFMGEYLRHPNNLDLINPELVDGKLIDFIHRGILVQETIDTPDGRSLRTTTLNRDDDLVREALSPASIE
jgi:uncharacterized LabA/DUF88 family protein